MTLELEPYEALLFDLDGVVTDTFDLGARKVGGLRTVAWDKIGPKDIGVDIGETTQAMFEGVVTRARTVLWNGPLGVAEIPATATGTLHQDARQYASVDSRET